jgi:WD40-like Beta Propeller Repeat
MRTRLRWNLAWSISLCAVLAAAGSGCASVKSPQTTGSGGSGGSLPAIPGLVSLQVTPPSQTVNLTADQNGVFTPGTAQYQAIGTMDDGTTKDVSTRVQWPSNLSALTISSGNASVTAPGTYSIVAQSGSITASATLIASFNGSFNAGAVTPDEKTSLDGSPGGTAVQIAYPLDGSVFPARLGSIYVHIVKSGSPTAARLEFQAGGLDILWYGKCEVDPVNLPGAGCYVQLPAAFTALLIPASDHEDITVTARVGGAGAPSQAPPIKVAWSNVSLTGGIYYWTTIQPGPIYPGYTLPAMATSGTGIQRYDFKNDVPVPQLVYTDQGAPTMAAGAALPTYPGSPWARDSAGGQGTCVGCHAISNSGKFMAMAVNGSDASGFVMLDIANKVLLPVSAVNAGQPLQRFIKEGCAGIPTLGCGAMTTFGPKDDLMVNMYKSKLYLRATDMTLANQGEVVPSTADPYRTDPFWSQDGQFLAFTGFRTPDTGLNRYNATGLNGDEESGGQIWVASAEATGVHDDAHVVVPTQPGATSYYPAISNDDKLLVYNQSTCTQGAVDPNKLATDYGSETCDGYDDWTSTLWLTSPDGSKRPVRLDRANGTLPASNSWPRWSPDNGMFRGQRLYWIAFSSRRPYGLQVNYGMAPSLAKPQLWFAAVLTGGEFTSDPSFAPVWLPAQNPNQSLPNGNHVPQWVKFVVPLIQ